MSPTLEGHESVLRNRNYVQLLGGRLTAALATQIQSVVVSWQIYAITHNPLALGYVGLAQFLPMVALVLPAGDMADRFERRLLLGFSWIAQAVASILFLVLTLIHPDTVHPFYAVLVLFGMARAFSGPAMQSLLPLLVVERNLGKAIALNSSAFQIAVIGGPAFGGAVYILGPTVAYSLCAVLLITASVSVLLIHMQKVARAPQSHSSAFQRFFAGIEYMRYQPIVLGAISLDLFAVLFGGAIALLPVYAREVLQVGPVGLGALRSSIAVGAFLMGIYLGRRALDRHAGAVMFASVGVFGIATVVFGLSHVFTLSLSALVIVGASDMISVFVRTTLIQLATPDEMRGRVSAVNQLFIGASNELGEFESGVTAAWIGAVPAVVAGGIGSVVVVGLWMWLFPSLRRVDRLTDVSVQQSS